MGIAQGCVSGDIFLSGLVLSFRLSSLPKVAQPEKPKKFRSTGKGKKGRERGSGPGPIESGCGGEQGCVEWRAMRRLVDRALGKSHHYKSGVFFSQTVVLRILNLSGRNTRARDWRASTIAQFVFCLFPPPRRLRFSLLAAEMN